MPDASPAPLAPSQRHRARCVPSKTTAAPHSRPTATHSAATGRFSRRCPSIASSPRRFSAISPRRTSSGSPIAIDKLDRFLDPVIAVPAGDGKYWSPNGYHRLGAMKQLGAKSIVALVVPEVEVAHRILLLNTEKAHNLRERALEVSRLAEALAELDDRPEREFAIEFEEAALVTLGFCYQQNGRFAGGAFHPVLKRCDKFLGSKLPKAIETRRERANKLLELNEAVNAAVASLKERGFESPYLKAFVVARINPLRFQRKPTADFDETIDKMIGSATRFDAGKIRVDQVARTGGAPDESA